MAKIINNEAVDAFLQRADKWRAEFEKLREILCDCDLTEVVKWGNPCYIHEQSNIVLIHGFKEYCALLFFKGALMKDTKGILIQQTANVQAARQIRFTNLEQIVELEETLKDYVREAVQVELSGVKVPQKTTSALDFPEEFKRKLEEFLDLEEAFKALTPGRQRVYLHHFSEPKQAKTREARVEKCIQQILEGKGLYD
jgi:uncharacterized protein YdeI (YjbR/CyaY-like superfamily)